MEFRTESNVALIKALAAALLSELDSLNAGDEIITANAGFNLTERVREFEIKLIKTALLKADGNQRRAARLLGVPTSTLNNKIKAYDIQCLKNPESDFKYLRDAALNAH
jgi:DNA-binding NtrC family response regulator